MAKEMGFGKKRSPATTQRARPFKKGTGFEDIDR